MFQWRVCKYVFLICFVRFLFCWPWMMVGSSFSLCLHRWFYSVDLFQSFLPFILFFLGFQVDLIRLPVKREWLDMYRRGTWLCLCELLHLGREENLVDFLVTCQSVFFFALHRKSGWFYYIFQSFFLCRFIHILQMTCLIMIGSKSEW